MVFTPGLRHTFALLQRALALVQFPAVQASLARLGRCRTNLALCGPSLLPSLSSDILARLKLLHEHVGIAVPDNLGVGLDSLSPIIEHFMSVGGIFFVKWDGERTKNRYTAIAMHPKIEQFRFDDKTPALVASRVLLHLAGDVFDFPDETS